MIDDLPLHGPDGGVVVMHATAGWSWLIATVGIAIVVLGGLLLA